MYKCRHGGMCDYKERGAKQKTPEPKDLVEVVRCKDCKHYDLMLGWCDIHSHYTDEILDTWDMFMDDDYCSDGERR